MIDIAFSSSFRRAFKKRIKADKPLEDTFWITVDIFKDNPFDRRLHTHKLTGKLKELFSFTVDYDVRVIFFFTNGQSKAVLVDIGSHDDVY